MKNIPPLYHWSPSHNRADILGSGLLPTTPHRNGTLTVCLGTDPLSAWALSGDMREGQDWDLFQVHVADTPLFRVRHWGRWSEYRIPRPVGSQACVYVGSKRIGADLAR